MSALRGARARARAEVITAIKDEARRQLGEVGAAKLSLRAVARELGMVSSALYRYFPSRDDLLTALILDAYNALGDAAEQALAEVAEEPPMTGWLAVGRAVRRWALAHPHEYALVYGSPVPGYVAPPQTATAAGRVALTLMAVVRRAAARGRLAVPRVAEGAQAPGPLRADLERLREDFGEEGDGEGMFTEEFVVAWTTLIGMISFELFGHYRRVIDARDEFFDLTMARLGHAVGLPLQEATAEPGSRSGS